MGRSPAQVLPAPELTRRARQTVRFQIDSSGEARPHLAVSRCRSPTCSGACGNQFPAFATVLDQERPLNPPSEPVGRSYSEPMRIRSFARLAVLVAVVSIIAGCAAANGANGDGGSTAPPVQLRLVTSSAPGPCSAPPLTSDGPGTTCDEAGTTTYELGESLGVMTPASVTRDGQGAGQDVVVEFDKAGASTLSDVTGKAIDRQLALLLKGKVLSAPTVKAPLTDGKVAFGFETASQADQFEALLGPSATS